MRRSISVLGIALAALTMTFTVQAKAQEFREPSSKDHWAYEAVTELPAKEILLGYPDGLFHGKDVVTRFVFAVVLQRLDSLLNIPSPHDPAKTEGERFKDGIGDWSFYDAVTDLHAKEILIGYPDGCYHGTDALTRYAFAVALKRLLDAIAR